MSSIPEGMPFGLSFLSVFFRCACVRSFVTVKSEGGIVTIIYRFRRKDYHV